MGQDGEMEREETKTLLKLAGGGGLVGRVIGNKLLTPSFRKTLSSICMPLLLRPAQISSNLPEGNPLTLNYKQRGTFKRER